MVKLVFRDLLEFQEVREHAEKEVFLEKEDLWVNQDYPELKEQQAVKAVMDLQYELASFTLS